MGIPLYNVYIHYYYIIITTSGEGRRVEGRDRPIGMRRKRDREREEGREGGAWGTGS